MKNADLLSIKNVEGGEMKEALIMLITERLGAGNWDRLPTGDLYRIFNNLKDSQGKEGAVNIALQNPDSVMAFSSEDHP